MRPTSRLATSVHLMAYLGHKEGLPVTSKELAASVHTHPVVIRRLLSRLKRSRLVLAEKGAKGGFRLAGEPDRITLLEVYRAVEPEASAGLKRFSPNTECPVGGRIGSILEKAFYRAQAGMEAELRQITLGEVLRQLRPDCPSEAKARTANQGPPFTPD